MSLAARLATPLAQIGEYSAIWSGPCGDSTTHIDSLDVGPRRNPPSLMAKRARGWPARCAHCGERLDWATTDVALASGTRMVWDTPSGDLEPGCLYWEIRYSERRGQLNKHWCSAGWTNCDGRHLYAVLPNRHYWDIDSRASNCTLKSDWEHRCWVRHGEPPLITVDKAGITCAAGAGSILAGDYHGFLQNGIFT